MSNTIDKHIIVTFSIVSNPYPCHPYMFATENYSSKFTIMPFWAPASKSPAENGILKKSLDTSLYISVNKYITNCFINPYRDIHLRKDLLISVLSRMLPIFLYINQHNSLC